MHSNGNTDAFKQFIYESLQGKIRTVRAKSKRIYGGLYFNVIKKKQLRKYREFFNKHDVPWKQIKNTNELTPYFQEIRDKSIILEEDEIGFLFCQQLIVGDIKSNNSYAALMNRERELTQPKHEIFVRTNKDNMKLLDNIISKERYITIVIDTKNEGIVSSIYKHVINQEIKFKRTKVLNINFNIEGLSTFTITEIFSDFISHKVTTVLFKSSIPYCTFDDYEGEIQFFTHLFEDSKKKSIQGFREDLQHVFNSAMEANFARILNHLGISWKYEVIGFGNDEYTYIPDFFLGDNIIIETKGFWDKRSRDNVFLFKKYEKAYILLPLDYDMFYTLNKIYADKLDYWEKYIVNVKNETLAIVGINQGQRKKYISKLELQEEVYLKREPNNKFDENAIQVFNENNEQLGYVSKEMASIYSGKLDMGMKFKAKVHEKRDDVLYIKVLRTNLDDIIIYDFLKEDEG